jgi:predicted RNA-binding protein associated with RNAse of E/G family
VTDAVHIHYLRPPARLEVYRQILVHDDNRVKVTLARSLPFDPPLLIQGKVALEKGSDAVWFTFPGAWHDIGRFHTADGTFTGVYANVITPVVFHTRGDWETTDLFLDLWLPAEGGEPALLDEAELTAALASGHLGEKMAARARAEIVALQEGLARGEWPPPEVERWTRRRAMEAADQLASASSTRWAAQSRSRST